MGCGGVVNAKSGKCMQYGCRASGLWLSVRWRLMYRSHHNKTINSTTKAPLVAMSVFRTTWVRMVEPCLKERRITPYRDMLLPFGRPWKPLASGL